MGRQIHISSLLTEKNNNRSELSILLTNTTSREPAQPVWGKLAHPRIILDELKGVGTFNLNKLTLLNFHFTSDLNLSWEQPSSVSYGISERCPGRNSWAIFKYPKQRDTMFYIHLKPSFLNQSTSRDAGKVNKSPLLVVSNSNMPLQVPFQ